MPPVPMTFRQAVKTDYIDGVLVPEGTLFYIPVRFHSPSAYLPISSLINFQNYLARPLLIIILDSSDQHVERGLG